MAPEMVLTTTAGVRRTRDLPPLDRAVEHGGHRRDGRLDEAIQGVAKQARVALELDRQAGEAAQELRPEREVDVLLHDGAQIVA